MKFRRTAEGDETRHEGVVIKGDDLQFLQKLQSRILSSSQFTEQKRAQFAYLSSECWDGSANCLHRLPPVSRTYFYHRALL